MLASPITLRSPSPLRVKSEWYPTTPEIHERTLLWRRGKHRSWSDRETSSKCELVLYLTNITFFTKFLQEDFKGVDDKVNRVRHKPKRSGWAKIYDLIWQSDKDRVNDYNEDIDTLMVFVSRRISLASFLLCPKLSYNRLGSSRQSSLRLSSSHTKTFNNKPTISPIIF